MEKKKRTIEAEYGEEDYEYYGEEETKEAAQVTTKPADVMSNPPDQFNTYAAMDS